MSAYRRAGVLRFAALQLVVLTACAMALYPGGTWLDPATTHYDLAHNFLSDLGATRAFSGRANYASAVPFAIALVTIGAALVAFSWSWRGFAFGRKRARAVGVATALLGTASGAAFACVALTPVDYVVVLHTVLVLVAFGLLVGYVACLTLLMWRNGVGRLAINLGYLAFVVGYFALALLAPWRGTERGLVVQVIAQKIAVYGSMLYIVYLTTTTRRALARS